MGAPDLDATNPNNYFYAPRAFPQINNEESFKRLVDDSGSRAYLQLDNLVGGIASYLGKTIRRSNDGPVHHYIGLFPRKEGMIKIDVWHCKEEYGANPTILEVQSNLAPKILDPIALYRFLEQVYNKHSKDYPI